MASLYPRKDSPYWWASLYDAGSLSWKNVKTPCRQDDPAGRRNALVWAASQERVAVAERPLMKAESWAVWVDVWLRQTFGYNQRTLQRYLDAWAVLNEFLTEHEIHLPRHLKRAHAFTFLTWRTGQTRRRGSKINHNTAVTELKVLSRIMQEALLRGYCDGNPLTRLGIRRQNVRHTPRMYPEDIVKAREALASGRYPAWMIPCFEIALHHGCRLSETQVPMDRVHLDPRTNASENWDRITFECKGRHGQKVIHTVPLHPALRPLMQQLKQRGVRYTCELPRMAAKEWWKFRRNESLQHLRFHSTRSTVASVLAESGVNQQTAMSILVHASETVHLAYQHLTAKPVGDAIARVSYAGAVLGMPGTPGDSSATAAASPPSSSGRKTGRPRRRARTS
jgi:integrase